MLLKYFLHSYLHKKNNHIISSYSPFIIRPHPVILFPYTKKVSREFEMMKHICNIFWLIYILIFFSFIFIPFR